MKIVDVDTTPVGGNVHIAVVVDKNIQNITIYLVGIGRKIVQLFHQSLA